MIDHDRIERATDRLLELGPAGVLDPQELCTVLGIEFQALVRESATAARTSVKNVLEDAVAAGGEMDLVDLHSRFATEHMLGFLTGVVAQHMEQSA